MTDPIDPLTNIQQALEAAEGKLERIVEAFDHLDCGVFLYDADDQLVFCNARASEIYQGISDLLVPGMEYETLLREFYRRDLNLEREYSEDEWVAERIQRHRSSAPSEYEVQMRSGRWLLVSDRKTADGGTIGFRFDITSRKEAEFALAESERRLRGLLNMSADWYWEQNADYQFRRISSGMMRATGIIGLAQSLGLRVVAEGVEYPAQLDFLLSAGCTEAQGFLLAKPMSPAAFQERY